MTSGLSNAVSDAFRRRLDKFLHNNKYLLEITYLDSQKLTSNRLLKVRLCVDTFCCVKNYLDVAGMHPTRRWKALISYFTIPISLK